MNDDSRPAGEEDNMILGTSDGQSIISEPMRKSLSRRHLLMGAAMLGVSGLGFARMPQRKYDKLNTKQVEGYIPKQFGDWTIQPSSELILPPAGDSLDNTYEHIVTRSYINKAGDVVMFLIAYNSEQVNNVQVHRPEFCYSAAGFSINSSTPYEVTLLDNRHIPARAVITQRSNRYENVIYWTRLGDAFPQSWLQQRIEMTKSNIEGYFADGLLLRASAIEKDPVQSFSQLSSFLRQMEAACPPAGRHFLFRT